MKNGRSQRIETGQWGESAALDFLLTKGYSLLERNFRSPDGEIDLVMKNGGELVFVEVKTRTSHAFGYPEEAVDDEKLDHIEAATSWYLMEHPEFEDNWRFEVVAVTGSPGCTSPQVDWFTNASSE